MTFPKVTGVLLVTSLSALGVDFDKDIRPLLQKRCVECHGVKKQKGELRLDAKVFAFKGGHDGAAIASGSSDRSPLYQRVISTDEDERMPPKGEPLAAAETKAIKQWIDAGAVWPENDADRAAAIDKRLQHWSVQPVKRFDNTASIDEFIQAKLKERGLTMSPEADRRTLIRRLSFDLLGLPPSPERVTQFVEDTSPRAYEALVDEMLASPHYGERWARHWLDIAHYADTHGFERDQLRPNAWRYRDYVIASLNHDKPYDQFIREQIAGDVLSPNDPQAIIATGFLAAGPWDFVGQVETKSDMLKRAARAGDLDDMVTQVITSTMGITINCARCHDHKLDPITQQEYYSLWSVFAGVKRGERDANPAEAARISDDRGKLQKRLRAVRAELGGLLGEGLDLADMVGGGDGRGTGIKGAGIDIRNGTFTTEKLGYHRNIQTNRLQRVSQTGNWCAQFVFVPDGRQPVPVVFKQEVKLPPTSGHTWDAIRNGPLAAQRSTTIDGVDYAKEGRSILGLHANSGITFDLKEIRTPNGYTDMRFRAVVGFGADKGAANSLADFTVFVDTEQRFQKLRMKKTELAQVDIELPANAKTLTLVATDGGDGIGSDLLFLGDAKLISATAESKIAAADQTRLTDLRSQATQLEAEIKALPEPAKVYATVSEAKPEIIHVQRRGNPEDPQEDAKPGTFAWTKHASFEFGDNTTPEGERRAALAKWITASANPLTRRVLVNRLWHHHFGQGIVNTPSDFGLGGDKPSHPELLDWLADEFLKSGWSVKHMQKLIVLSKAYRQRSGSSELSGKSDSANRLLSRQNPRRLDAESLRDAVLSVAGTLNPEMGGPGYRDFNYTEAYAPIYEYTTADKPELWRRSIYRFIVRTTPHQFMSTLDCPNPANLTPARVQTTTALQALALSNNEFMLQQAGYLAKRIGKEAGDTSKRIHRAFDLAFQRAPSRAEIDAATRLVDHQGLFALCRMLINANEFVYVD